MKKFLAILLAMMLVMVSVAAMAANVDPDTGTKPPKPISEYRSDATSFTTNGFIKTYDDADTAIIPDETLEFTSTPDSGNPDTTNVTITGYKATDKSGNITVNIPSYSKAGVYKYTIAEKPGSSQGVTYSTDTVGMTVLVSYDYENEKLVTTIGITKNTSGVKENEFTNKYEVGDLELTKTVSGNLANREQYFEVTVTFTATNKVNSDITVSGASDEESNQTVLKGWTGNKPVNVKIKHNETITFQNVPKDVTYTVVEAAKHSQADPNGTDGSKGYTVTYSEETKKITASTVSTSITNTKNVTPDTGITLETLPYVLMMALAMMGLVALKLRKREEY